MRYILVRFQIGAISLTFATLWSFRYESWPIRVFSMLIVGSTSTALASEIRVRSSPFQNRIVLISLCSAVLGSLFVESATINKFTLILTLLKKKNVDLGPSSWWYICLRHAQILHTRFRILRLEKIYRVFKSKLPTT